VRHDGLGNYGGSPGVSQLEMGGGNFLMMTALMNVLGLLAKVYLRLTEPDDFSTDEHRKIVKESRALVADRLPELKTTVKTGWTEWRLPRAGDCNEERAFKKLVAALSPTFELGIPEEKATEVWRKFRNYLTHMAWPDGSVAVYAVRGGSAKAEQELRSGGPPFRFLPEHGLWQCNADRLTFMVMDITDWVCDVIVACPHDERILEALEWMEPKD
jgi:hypothetical protein